MEKLPVIKDDQLIDKIGQGKVVLFFTAGWCPDCRFIKPAMPEIEQDFADYTFYTRSESYDPSTKAGPQSSGLTPSRSRPVISVSAARHRASRAACWPSST